MRAGRRGGGEQRRKRGQREVLKRASTIHETSVESGEFVMRKPLFSLTPKDFEGQTSRAASKGGQHQNKTDSAVRIVHRASGARAESREERSQHQNRRIAFRRLDDMHARSRS